MAGPEGLFTETMGYPGELAIEVTVMLGRKELAPGTLDRRIAQR